MMNPGQQMTLLGLLALGYYAVLLATGAASLDVMPQFMVSAIIFLSSGRLMRKSAKIRARRERDETGREKPEPNWELRTQILNWVMATLIICALGLFVMKPVGVSFFEILGLE
jgi:hypothetical protein